MANRQLVWDFLDLDDAGYFGGEPCEAGLAQAVAKNIQHLLCWSALRMVGAQFVPTPDETDRTTFYRWRIKHDWTNSRALIANILLLPKTVATGGTSPTCTVDGTSKAFSYYSTGVASTLPADGQQHRILKALAPTASDREIVFGTSNAARIAAVTIFQHMQTAMPAGAVLDDATYKLIDLLLFQPGKQVWAQDLGKLIDVVQNDTDAIFKVARRQHFCWSRRGSTSADAIVRTSATLANLLDQTILTRSTTSPGWHCPAKKAGRFSSGGKVECDAEVYCVQTGTGPGTVRFQSSVNSVDISIPAPTAAWYKSTQTLQLDTSAETDKVDVLIAGDGLTDLRVWAVRLQENPA